MTPLSEMLEHVLEGEPELGDEVDAIFRRADQLRRQRTRTLLASGAAIAGTTVLASYLLATTLLPGKSAPRPRPAAAPAPVASPSAVTVPSAVADPVLAVLAPVIDRRHLRIVPRAPHRGFGWRQYSVLTAGGAARGTIEVAVYARPDGLCFPRPSGQDGCAEADRTGGTDYERYDQASDPEWQVNETIARRVGDGRTVAVMATGERDAADAAGAEPALDGTEVQKIATDRRMMTAFGATEKCDGTAEDACPVFKIPVPGH